MVNENHKASHNQRKALFWSIVSGVSVLIATGFPLLVLAFEADLNYAIGGNAIVDNSFQTIRANSKGHALAYFVVSVVALVIVPITSAVLLGRRVYRGRDVRNQDLG